ncbi:C-C motif chemokine 28-like [Mustelus asterias]
MELKLAVLLLASVTTLLHISTAIPNTQVVNCCTQVANKMNPRILKIAKGFEIQRDHICAIKAVIVHTLKRALCLNPSNKHVQKWMKKNPGKQVHSRR